MNNHSNIARVSLAALVAGLVAPSCKSNDISETQNTTNNNTTVNNASYVTQVVGAAGATIDGPDGSQVVIPAGALSKDVSLRIGKLPDGAAPKLPEGTTAVGPVFTLEPHGQIFTGNVTIKLPGVGSVEHANCPSGSEDASQCAWDSAILGQGADGFTVFETPTFSLYGVVKTPDQPCEKVVSGTVCGTGANENVVYGCTNGLLTTQTVCKAGSYCRQNAADATPVPPPGCAEWEVVPPPPSDKSGFQGAIDYSGTLYAINNEGELWKLTADVPATSGDWVKDEGFAALQATFDASAPFPRFGLAAIANHLWIVGPAGFVGHMDAQGAWTKIDLGTTEHLSGVAAMNGPKVWIVGASGVLYSSGDGVTFTGGPVLDGGGQPITTGRLQAVATFSGYQFFGGAQVVLGHGTPGGGWVVDSTDLDPATLQSGNVFRILPPGGKSGAVVTVQSGGGGQILEATVASGGALAPIAWKTTHTNKNGGFRGSVVVDQRVFVVGQNGVAAIRDPSGVWADSPTGFSPTDTDSKNLTSVVRHGGQVLGIGGRFSPVVIRYIGL